MYRFKKLILICFFITNFIAAQNVNSINGGNIGQPSFKVDAKTKVRQVKQLLNNAVKHISKVTIEEACNDFIYNPIWRKGELYVFVIDEHGKTFADGDSTDLIWKDFIPKALVEGEHPLIGNLLTAGKKGKFVGFLQNSGYKSSFIKVIEKNGIKYVVGVGFFPEDHRYNAKQMAVNAAYLLNDYGPKYAFAYMSSPVGSLVKGDMFVIAYDFNGICVANGKNPEFVGQSFIHEKDSRGNEITKQIINIAKNKKDGFIQSYTDGEVRNIYVLRAIDPKSKKAYAITVGYYPNQSLEKVQSFVNKAIAYIKENGAEKSFADFTNPVGEFVKSGLAIYVYDLEGKCLANGYQPQLVGRNMINFQDQKGHYIVKLMLKKLENIDQGVMTNYQKNSTQINFFRKIDVPDGKFIIGASYFPESKKQTVETLVEQAKEHLQNLPNAFVFDQFSTPDGLFQHGDLHIFVYSPNGTRLVNGTQKGQIWLNFSKTTDQNGKPIISDLITTALNGGGWLDYKTRNDNRKIFVQEVTKKNSVGEPETFIIGSGYFL